MNYVDKGRYQMYGEKSTFQFFNPRYNVSIRKKTDTIMYVK